MKIALFVFALVLGFTTQSFAAIAADSKYSSLEDKDCNLIASSDDDADAPIDYFKSICPGQDGYLVKFAGGDIRSWVGILKPGEKYEAAADFFAALMEGSRGQFPNVQGSKLEWRYNDGKLVAFILRMTAQDPEAVEKNLENLVVLRVPSSDFSQVCLIGSIDTTAIKDSNVSARAIADDASKQCP
ncbi:hypothetical protein BH10BDE1_BH10BDE1_19080 [soil metagenome]